LTKKGKGVIMAKKTGNDYSEKRKRITTIGKGKNSKPMKKARNKKRGMSKYRGQGR
jgi:hypothetical protein